MDDDPFSGSGLRPVELIDRSALEPYFKSLSHSGDQPWAEPLSDYTFSQLFTWRNSLRLFWKVIENHLCVFANGTGDLTLLMPPLGDSGGTGSGDRALRQAFEIMDAYNVAHGVPDRSRVEYTSESLLTRFSAAGLAAQPMGADYLYDVQRMIDLAGGDLASKRQAKNRFQRNYVHRVEDYEAARHFEPCRALLENWRDHQDVAHVFDGSNSSRKRQKESLATELALRHAHDLGLRGMVVYVVDPETRDESIRGFTFGETLSPRQSSIVIEKTDLRIKGLAQFIFSEFCRRHWSALPLVNVGDDWGLETLAWTKQSYRPVRMLQKFVLTQQPRTALPLNAEQPVPAAVTAAPPRFAVPSDPAIFREASRDDLASAVALEEACFTTHRITRRQMQYLLSRPSALFIVAEQQERIVAQGIALIRHHKSGKSGRIYSLAVSTPARRQKLGQRLMNRLIATLESRGVRRLYLEVEKTNTPAINLYEGLGFRAIGLLPNYYGPGFDALHMMYDVHAPEQRQLIFDPIHPPEAVAASENPRNQYQP